MKIRGFGASKKEKQICKPVFNNHVCKLKSGNVLTFPKYDESPLILNFYTSPDCAPCQETLERVQKINQEQFGNLFNVHVKDVRQQSTPMFIYKLPTLTVNMKGEPEHPKHILKGTHFNEDDLIKLARESTKQSLY